MVLLPICEPLNKFNWLNFLFHLTALSKLLIFSRRTLYAALLAAILLLKNRFFELAGSTIKKRKKESNRTILLHFSSRIW